MGKELNCVDENLPLTLQKGDSSASTHTLVEVAMTRKSYHPQKELPPCNSPSLVLAPQSGPPCMYVLL